MDVQPTTLVKLPPTREYAQLLSNFTIEHSSDFSNIDVMNMQSFINELNKMLISNINKHHHIMIDSYFRSVCDMVKTSSLD